MTSLRRGCLVVWGAWLALGSVPLARAEETLKADLVGFAEVPAISSTGSGEATLVINDARTSIAYDISYEGLEGNITQAHIHLGQLSVNGGICVFLCSNLGNGPAGTPACPVAPGNVTGTLTAEDIVGPSTQGIPATQIARVLDAMSNGTTYVNVHTDKYPAGEIRGQVGPNTSRMAGVESWLPGALMTGLSLFAVLAVASVVLRKRRIAQAAAA